MSRLSWTPSSWKSAYGGEPDEFVELVGRDRVVLSLGAERAGRLDHEIDAPAFPEDWQLAPLVSGKPVEHMERVRVRLRSPEAAAFLEKVRGERRPDALKSQSALLKLFRCHSSA